MIGNEAHSYYQETNEKPLLRQDENISKQVGNLENAQSIRYQKETDRFIALVVFLILAESLASFPASAWTLSTAILPWLYVFSKVFAEEERTESVKRFLWYGFVFALGWLLTLACFPDFEVQTWASQKGAVRGESGKPESERRDAQFFGTAEVIAEPDHSREGLQRFSVRLLTYDGLLCPSRVKLQVDAADVPWSNSQDLHQASNISGNFSAEFYATQKGQYPSPLSYQGSYFRKGYIGRAKVGNLTITEQPHEASLPREKRFVAKLVQQYHGTAALAVILAGAYGEKDLLDKETLELFRRTGLSHLLVVSGYHIGVVFAFCQALLRGLYQAFEMLLILYPLELAAVVFCIPILGGYTTLAGWNVPSARAYFALLIFSFGKILTRRADIVRAYCFLCMLTCLIWPGCFFEVGTQLTFSALLGLMVGERWRKRLFGNKRDSISVRIASTFLLCVAPTLYTAPVLLLWFQSIAPFGVIYNVFFGSLFCIWCTVYSGFALAFDFLSFPGASAFIRLSLLGTEGILWLLSTLDRELSSLGLGYREMSSGAANWLALCTGIFSISLLFYERKQALTPNCLGIYTRAKDSCSERSTDPAKERESRL